MDTNPVTVRDAASIPAAPYIPRSTAVAWRLAPLADNRRLDALLRVFGARALPMGVNRGRLAAMGLPSDVSEQALRKVRAVDDWDLGWTWAAQRFLGEARVHERVGAGDAAALAQRHAALAYHLAAMLVFDDTRKIRALRASASSLYARSLPLLRPAVRRVDVRWRTARLPAYLALPESDSGPAPLVVLLNGTSTSKEETLLWSDAFLAHDLAVLALDWPGSGESALTVPPTADCDDFTDGVLAIASEHHGIDANRVALVGFSLGGAVAAIAAANDRRIGAVVAVTPPYDPRRWYAQAQPLLRRHLATLAGGEGRVARLAGAFALPGIVERTRCPILVIGAGRDLIVPPEEAVRYCAAAGPRGTLLWYPHGSHGLFELLPDWTTETARWLVAVLLEITPSTWVDETAESLAAAL
ncbi:MAG: alpha/beta hydrolase family protein [Thermomicrobiales bacterium]